MRTTPNGALSGSSSGYVILLFYCSWFRTAYVSRKVPFLAGRSDFSSFGFWIDWRDLGGGGDLATKKRRL
jgi:hypothetical protein